MKRAILAALMFCSSVISHAQHDVTDSTDIQNEIRIKKTILVNDLENHIRRIPISVVRALARYRIASWLWKDGRDEIGRAEEISIKAVEDLINNKEGTPPVYYSMLLPRILALLDRNAPNVSRALREKHPDALTQESDHWYSLLQLDGGDKLAVDRAIRSLASETSDFRLVTLLGGLLQRRSPQFLRLAEAILHTEESGRNIFPASTFVMLTEYFVGGVVPVQLEDRFLKIVISRSVAAGQMPSGDVSGFFDLLDRTMPVIATKSPETFSQASIAQAVLRSRITRERREAEERNERIRNSHDMLAAIVFEAKQSNNVFVKYDLFLRGSRLAIEKDKLIYAVDLVRLSKEVDMSSSPVPEDILSNERDQILEEVVARSLKQDDPTSASYAIKDLSRSMRKARMLTLKSEYFVNKGDKIAALTDLREAIKTATQIESLSRRATIYTEMLSVAHSIDPAWVNEVIVHAAKAINDIPGLDVEDTPETENYQNYVTQIMMVNLSLLTTLPRLAKVDKNGAGNLVSRIDKNEIRIIAACVVEIEALEKSTNIEEEVSTSSSYIKETPDVN